MQFTIDNILIVPSKNDFMNEIGAFVTVYTHKYPQVILNLSYFALVGRCLWTKFLKNDQVFSQSICHSDYKLLIL